MSFRDDFAYDHRRAAQMDRANRTAEVVIGKQMSVLTKNDPG
jgi:hypothetical protein